MRVLALLAALAVVAVAAGCGGRGSQPDLVNGKTLFVQKCGSCHTLARANTKGIQGPNLDAAFIEARRQGFKDSGIKGVVYNQISHVRRGSIMPLNLVTGQNAKDVAAYVGFAAGNPGKDSGELASAGQPKQSSKPAVEHNGQLTIPADPTGALAFQYSKANATAGQVTLVMPNKSPITHDISIKGNGVSQQGNQVGNGGTSKVTVNLKPGTYTFYCSVPGHEAGGMKGTLTVK
ncbi:MAG TPA: plastocyanin/azurin family copper-binding protein [Thermoleophilaceae bacterium]|jgi:plastocyanin